MREVTNKQLMRWVRGGWKPNVSKLPPTTAEIKKWLEISKRSEKNFKRLLDLRSVGVSK